MQVIVNPLGMLVWSSICLVAGVALTLWLQKAWKNINGD